jgi:subtilisin family serine protease
MNMSLGTVIPKGGPGTNEISALANAVRHAMDYAEKQGVTVVVSAGNAASDLDGGDQGAVRFQTGLGSNLGISATTAVGYYTPGGVGQDLIPTSYTNYGTSMVDFAAPGGDTLYPGNEVCAVPSGAGTVFQLCWVLDLIFSTGSNLTPGVASYYWSGGTSMAAPHAAGVAALIISETGNSNPAHVRQEMRQRALEGGKPGRDDFFGHGQANTGN